MHLWWCQGHFGGGGKATMVQGCDTWSVETLRVRRSSCQCFELTLPVHWGRCRDLHKDTLPGAWTGPGAPGWQDRSLPFRS